MFRFLVQRNRSKGRTQQGEASAQQVIDSGRRIEPSVQSNIAYIQQLLGSPSDLILREFTIGPLKHPCALVAIDGLFDRKVLNEEVLRVMLSGEWQQHKELPEDGDQLLQMLQQEVLSVTDILKATTMDELMLEVMSGNAALFVSGSHQALTLSSQGWKSRAIQEPVTEQLIRGPRDGFTEDLRSNTAAIRRRLKDPNLRFDTVKIGRRAKKDIVICYIEGIVNPELVKEAKRRVDTIDLDDTEDSGMIEQWIMDSFMSPFPQLQSTERPDRTSASLVQGGVAILVDGTPFGLTLPLTITALVQSPEDYYHHWIIATLMRVLRMIAAFIATFLPALYIALVEFHQGMIPSKLAFSIAGSREGVPFPGVIEAVLMEVTLEVLREAGVRLPKPIGQTIGIVGGLVIGEAAVSAGIVSPIMVIVVSITAIASFALPSYTFAISLRILRFGIMMLAAVFGLFGIVLAYIMINIHLVNLKSFGVPFLTPFAPYLKKDWKDLVIRAPVTMLTRRPQMLQTDDKVRMNTRGDSTQ
ncbi:spore germination protein [Paenibacillus cremeus]|uniref:Spore germination protein n=1 Tax=Paenibacillus cremeus TaxID=2163881 RepID=A0A559K437_9BACL|nr:spore germination protein [Paenibacillus cremeus]TVY06876.1 spore germination protein [Paenibacillus cremeus]